MISVTHLWFRLNFNHTADELLDPRDGGAAVTTFILAWSKMSGTQSWRG